MEDFTPLSVVRYPHTQAEVDKLYRNEKTNSVSFSQNVRSKCTCSMKDVGRYFVSLVPIISVVRTYKLQYVLGDLLSGVSAACLHFPQGLAFGLLASLAPSYGLYTSFFPVILYLIFGSSPHISIGTNAVISLFTADLVRENVAYPPLTPNHNTTSNMSASKLTTADDMFLIEKASVASGASLLVGVILLILGLLRLGFLTSYLSSSFVSAFTTTAAVHIITSQVPKALGLQIKAISGPGKLVLSYIEIFKSLPNANICSVVTSIICLIILVFIKDFINERYKEKMKMPIPIDLILVVIATIISHFTNLNDDFEVRVVGTIPTGIPTPALPTVKPNIIGNAVVIAVVIFVLNISLVRICEAKHEYQVNNDQELIAYGASNFVSSFFWCFPSCSAPPRTVILSTMGSKTTLNGVFTAAILLLMLLVLGQYFTSLPIPVLSIMVIVAVKNLLVQMRQLPNMWRVSKYDLAIWLATFLSGVFIDFPYAIYIGVLMCLFTVVIQSQRSKSYSMQKSTKEELYLDSSEYEGVTSDDDVTIFRLESSLYFATAQLFRSRLYAVTGDPRKVQNAQTELIINEPKSDEESDDDASKALNNNMLQNNEQNRSPTLWTKKFVIIDCSSVNYLDMNGINMLSQVISEYEKSGVTLMVARCTRYMLDMIERSTLAEKLAENRVFPDITDAVYATRQT